MSTESSSFRIDWSPSRLLCQCLAGLTVLACLSVWLGNGSLPEKLLALPVLLVYGTWMVRRETRRRPFAMQLSADGRSAVLAFPGRQLALSQVRIHVRGPIASASGLAPDGKRVRILWPPDTLSPSTRRKLRLAAGTSVAPIDPTIATLSG